jgi:hypothetical protein
MFDARIWRSEIKTTSHRGTEFHKAILCAPFVSLRISVVNAFLQMNVFAVAIFKTHFSGIPFLHSTAAPAFSTHSIKQRTLPLQFFHP